ncbi:MAG: HhH-GPD-type base excision DNA repair protein [Actinomycetota bacterium]|nr:HhH-GPD-type base excision DNA repair protein [Actinomycetota bacterium]
MQDIYFTAIPEANALLADDAYALLVGLTLYQQVPTEKAFAGPYVLKERLGGTLDASLVAAMDPEELDAVFREKPALHRFPTNMAKRVQSVSQFLVDEYGGDASAIWSDVSTADALQTRLVAIPGFGEYKARLTIGVLAKHYGVKPRGYTKHLPDWPSIVDIKTPEGLVELKARKKAWKASRS